jgi:hypothetical protein
VPADRRRAARRQRVVPGRVRGELLHPARVEDLALFAYAMD